ncbi:Uma2 family endonuclease [Singulisphaera rosea]
MDQGRRMTLEEFHEADEIPGSLYELARGVLEVGEVPGDDHGQVVDNLHEGFSDYRRRYPNRILRIGHGSDLRLVIPDAVSARHPDLGMAFRSPSQGSRGRLGVVVEVVSAGRAARDRDYVAKRGESFGLDIDEYWIVDPMLRQVTVLERKQGDGGGDWTWEEHVFLGDDTIVSHALPGFEGLLWSLWCDAANLDRPLGDH